MPRSESPADRPWSGTPVRCVERAGRICYNLYMSETIPLHRFRAHLAEALRKVEHGKTIVVTKFGRPVAELRPSEIRWGGLSVRPAKHRRPCAIRSFRGPGIMSRQILEERRRDG